MRSSSGAVLRCLLGTGSVGNRQDLPPLAWAKFPISVRMPWRLAVCTSRLRCLTLVVARPCCRPGCRSAEARDVHAAVDAGEVRPVGGQAVGDSAHKAALSRTFTKDEQNRARVLGPQV